MKLGIVSLEAPPVNNVDFRAAGATKHSGNEVTGATGSPSLSKADKKQQKNRRQKDNHMQSHRPVSLVSKGEVKQMKIGPFPTAADLPANGLLFDLERVDLDDVQKPGSNGTGGLIPVAVTLKTKIKVPKSVKVALDIENNWGSAPPNQQRVYSRLEKNFDAVTMQLFPTAGGGVHQTTQLCLWVAPSRGGASQLRRPPMMVSWV